MTDVKLSLVPYHIKARTPEELTLACLENNVAKQRFFQYFDIQKQGNFWIAWYVDDVAGELNGDK